MKLMDCIRDWSRGYSEADVSSAASKLEDHWALPAGSIIPMTGREMRAIAGENLMQLFWNVRNLEFVNHPDKRREPKTEDPK